MMNFLGPIVVDQKIIVKSPGCIHIFPSEYANPYPDNAEKAAIGYFVQSKTEMFSYSSQILRTKGQVDVQCMEDAIEEYNKRARLSLEKTFVGLTSVNGPIKHRGVQILIEFPCSWKDTISHAEHDHIFVVDTVDNLPTLDWAENRTRCYIITRDSTPRGYTRRLYSKTGVLNLPIIVEQRIVVKSQGCAHFFPSHESPYPDGAEKVVVGYVISEERVARSTNSDVPILETPEPYLDLVEHTMNGVSPNSNTDEVLRTEKIAGKDSDFLCMKNGIEEYNNRVHRSLEAMVSGSDDCKSSMVLPCNCLDTVLHADQNHVYVVKTYDDIPKVDESSQLVCIYVLDGIPSSRGNTWTYIGPKSDKENETND